VNNAIKSDETDSIDLLKLRAEVQRCLGHYSESVSDLTYVINTAKPDADTVTLMNLYESRGECYERMEKPEEAIKDYTEAIKLLQVSLKIIYPSTMLPTLGQHEEAIADYNRAVTLSKENEDISPILQQRECHITRQRNTMLQSSTSTSS